MELNGVEEGEDRMPDEEGERDEGERDGTARREHEATHVPFGDSSTHCVMGRRRTHHQRKERGSFDKIHNYDENELG